MVWGPERRFLKNGLVAFQPSCDSDHLKEVCVKMDSWALQIHKMIFFKDGLEMQNVSKFDADFGSLTMIITVWLLLFIHATPGLRQRRLMSS